jgi:hypothetical protein
MDEAIGVTPRRARARLVIAAAVACAVALPALAQAQPSRFRLETTIAPGQRATLSVGTVPRGEFAFRLRASSDGEKRFTLTQKRAGRAAFTVLRVPGPMASACQGAAGSLFCSGITTPATPGGRTWTFRLRNGGDRPLGVTLTITHRRVASAG